jgi:V/A-type H+/Na+-transporting ATPase subunit A
MTANDGRREIGAVSWINGPVVRATGVREAGMLEMVEVGPARLIGEIIGLQEDVVHGTRANIQVYEETSGLQAGETVIGTGMPLSVELGPGLLGGIFDGVQRPLSALAARLGNFIEIGRAHV